MSDNESDYYSGTNSESDDSDNEIEIKPKPLIFNPNTIEAYDSDEEEDVDAEDVDVEDDEQKGGADDLAYVSEEEEDEDDEDDDEDIELDEDGEPIQKGGQKSVKPKKITPAIIDDNDYDEDEDDEYDENYLQKFDSEITKSYINDFHPECLLNNYDEISKLTVVVRNSDNIIVDPLHRTIPYLTKYEKARVIGQRAKQIETGAKPLVRVPENIVDGYIIAELELREKKIPFIIRRPIPSGAFEYWKLADLENIDF